MDWVLLGRGLLIGFAIAAPVGPIGILCIQRTLHRGHLAGLVSGLGAATADACYGLVAGLGLTAVATFLSSQRVILGVIGGLFLAYLGVRMLLVPPATAAAMVQDGRGLGSAYTSTLLLTLTNPMTIFSFMAIFAGLGLATTAHQSNGMDVIVLVAGVFGGSALWWSVLSSVTARLRRRMHATAMAWINRGAGVSLLVFAGYLMLETFR